GPGHRPPPPGHLPPPQQAGEGVKAPRALLLPPPGEGHGRVVGKPASWPPAPPPRPHPNLPPQAGQGAKAMRALLPPPPCAGEGRGGGNPASRPRTPSTRAHPLQATVRSTSSCSSRRLRRPRVTDVDALGLRTAAATGAGWRPPPFAWARRTAGPGDRAGAAAQPARSEPRRRRGRAASWHAPGRRARAAARLRHGRI